jgi:curved DNA-binding protein CbpA
MGNTQGTGTAIPPSHIKIFNDLRKIQNPTTKVQMIQTILAGPEYVASAKRAGIYAELLNYIAQQQQQQEQPIRQQQEQSIRTQKQTYEQSNQIVTTQPKRSHIQRVEKANSEEKAIGYFQACLEVLGLEEEVALTEDTLKKAYKKATLKNHPDKGGSEKEFEKVTRAYAYLGEILRRIHGGRSTTANIDAPNALKDSRMKEYETVKHVEPVKLNPKKLDMDAFNKMFEQTRIPDPDGDGYGDWLTSQKEDSSGPKFGGKFNRDVFNQAFEDDAKNNSSKGNYIIYQPQSMIMAPSLGIELGRDRPDTFTAAYDADLNFTDLKQAYTTENTFSKQVAHVRVDPRNIEDYKNNREKAPGPLSSEELQRIQEGEKMMEERERIRQRRAAEELIQSDSYFERMKRLVITNN